MSDRRVALLIAITVFGVYAFFFGGEGWNQNSSFGLTRAIVEERTIRIDHFREGTEDVAFVGGHLYSNKMPGVAFMAVPVYSLLYNIERARGMNVNDALTASRNQYLCTVAVCATSGALIAALLFLLGLHFGVSPRWSMIVALVIAFGTPLFAYATLLFVHVPNAAFLLLAYWFANFRAFSRREKVAEGRMRDFLAGFFAGAAVLTNYLTAPAVGFIVLLVAWRRRQWLLAILGALPPLLLTAWYQIAALGGIFRNPITKNEVFVSKHAWFGIINPPQWDALVGITISPYRGLFFLSPILLLSIAGLVIWLRRREQLDSAVFFLALFALFFGFNVTFNGWRGGNGIGPRYLVPIIPFLGILLFPMREKLRLLWVVLGAISIANNFAAAAVDPQSREHHLANPLFDQVYPTLLRGSPLGHTSVNNYSFNLGEMLFGSGSVWSLLPVIVWMIVMTTILVRLTTTERPAEARP